MAEQPEVYKRTTKTSRGVKPVVISVIYSSPFYRNVIGVMWPGAG